uniref:Uncharacterized protein n=1 Tax=Trichogramma kaykai TaxID=54128 RepID=A0ABD2WVC5_9HYME
MGQKPSSVEDLTSLNPQMTTTTRKKSDSTRSIPTVASEKQQQQQQQQQQQTLECAISTSPAPSPVHSAEQLINNAESESEKKNTQADNDADSSQGRSRRTSWPIDVAAATAAYSTEPLSFSLNPRIAELGHLTAWQMMQNFENLTKVDNYLRSQVSSFNATMEDNISEKSIGSGDLPQEQSDVTANDSERHSATCTAIEIDLEPLDDGNKLNVITAAEMRLLIYRTYMSGLARKSKTVLL